MVPRAGFVGKVILVAAVMLAAGCFEPATITACAKACEPRTMKVVTADRCECAEAPR